MEAQQVANNPAPCSEWYEIEVINDPDFVYSLGERVNANDLIADYCDCMTDACTDVVKWLRSLPVPEAVAFVGEAWKMSYKLYKRCKSDITENLLCQYQIITQ